MKRPFMQTLKGLPMPGLTRKRVFVITALTHGHALMSGCDNVKKMQVIIFDEDGTGIDSLWIDEEYIAGNGRIRIDIDPDTGLIV